MEHVLSAYYDITHGLGLAILTPKWMEYCLDESTVDKFYQFGTNVFGINPSLPPMEVAKKSIEQVKTLQKLESEQSILILWQKKLVKGRYYRRSNRLENRISNLFLKCVCRRYDLTVTQIILTEGVRYIYCSIEKMG